MGLGGGGGGVPYHEGPHIALTPVCGIKGKKGIRVNPPPLPTGLHGHPLTCSILVHMFHSFTHVPLPPLNTHYCACYNNAAINVMPHPPQVGVGGGLVGGLTQNLGPRGRDFDPE